jgi:hypothetical protein
MRPRAVAEEVGLDAAAVRLALTRRARAGQMLHVESEYLAVLAAEETPAPAVPVVPKVTAYDPYDDPFAVPNDWTWQPDSLDDFEEEEAAEQVLIRARGVMEACSSDSSTGHCGSQF